MLAHIYVRKNRLILCTVLLFMFNQNTALALNRYESTYCEYLKKKLNDKELVTEMLRWRQYIASMEEIPPKYVWPSVGMGPGSHRFKAKVNWSLFDFNSPRPSLLLDFGTAVKANRDDLKAIFFGERSGFGYYLPMNKDEFLKHENGIRVLCIGRGIR